MGANAKITRGKTSARAKPTKSTKRANKPAAKKAVAAKPTKTATAKKPTKAPAQGASKAAAAKKPAKKPATRAASTAKKAATRVAPPAATPPPPPAPMPDASVEIDIDDDAVVDADAAKKPGALARFGRGVGSLLAKVTGRGKKKPVDDPTVEIVTDDIVATWPVGAKPPPPPGHDD